MRRREKETIVTSSLCQALRQYRGDVLKQAKRKYDARDLGKGAVLPCLSPAPARFLHFLSFPKVSVTWEIKVSIKNLRIKAQVLACTLVYFVLLTDIFNMLSAKLSKRRSSKQTSTTFRARKLSELSRKGPQSRKGSYPWQSNHGMPPLHKLRILRG